MILNYIVKENNILLKTILQKKLYISTNLLKKLKNGKCIFVNNKITNVNNYVSINDKIIVNFNNINKNILNLPTYNKNLDILYEDEYLIIANKDSDIDIHPTITNNNKTFANILANYYLKNNLNIDKIHIITRLDKNTSGLCIIAKNEYIQELFLRQKYLINLQKTYIAIAYGIFKRKNGIIEEKIARKKDTIIIREVNPNGNYSKTEYKVIKENKANNYSILKIKLHTGRTHQIRVHLSYINHPLLGDELYFNEYLSNNNITTNYNIFKYINRQALHCYKLSFIHPITHKYIEIKSDLPNDIKKLIN